MYEINGKFGQVRLCRTNIQNQKLETPFIFTGGGWHRCNDLYRIQRPSGLDGYTIFFSLSEGGRLRLNHKLYEIPGSSFTIIPPDIPTEYFTGKDQWWEFYWLHLGRTNTWILEKLLQTHGYIYQSAKAGKIGKMLESLFPEQTQPDETLYEITASRVISNILHLMLEDSYHILTISQKNSSIVPGIIRNIEDNYSDDIHISELASKNFISLQHLIRLFRAETGYTPYEYLKKHRLKKSVELLTYSDFSIYEIARQTGFSSANNFVYQFKNEYGITPANYRKFF